MCFMDVDDVSANLAMAVTQLCITCIYKCGGNILLLLESVS